MAYKPPLLISSLLLPSYFLSSTVLFSPNCNFLFFQEQFLAYARIYHNKRSYSDISWAYIHLYKTAFTSKSLSGRIHPKGCLEIFIKVYEWTGKSQGYPEIYTMSLSWWIQGYPKGCLEIYTKSWNGRIQENPKGCLEIYKSGKWTNTSLSGQTHP